MSGSFEGSTGLYGAGLLSVMTELGQSREKQPRRRAGQAWKRVAVVLVVIVMPVALLGVGRLGS